MRENSKNKNDGNDLVFDEFLFKTIVSLKTTLISIEKDSDQKTELIHDLADSMTAVAYNMRDMKDRSNKNDDDHTKIMGLVNDFRSRMDLVEAKFESENTQINGHVKEIKYAVQQFEKLLIEMKAVSKSVGAVQVDSKPKKKFYISDMLDSLWDAIKNLKVILIIILIISLLISLFIGGNGLVEEMKVAIKGLLN